MKQPTNPTFKKFTNNHPSLPAPWFFYNPMTSYLILITSLIVSAIIIPVEMTTGLAEENRK